MPAQLSGTQMHEWVMALSFVHMHQVRLQGSGRVVNQMFGVKADYAALKSLFECPGVRWNESLVGEWQTQVGPAVKRIPAKVPVEVQDAMFH